MAFSYMAFDIRHYGIRYYGSWHANVVPFQRSQEDIVVHSYCCREGNVVDD
jgi:hypothetical protein